jgi:signal transduction histidine kinase
MKSVYAFSVYLIFFILVFNSSVFAHEPSFYPGNDFHSRARFWSILTVILLLITIITLLIYNVRRSASSNRKLLELNNEITQQKDNLNLINQYLEEIISDRTKDLKEKNKQLSEYSSYLSHQIRGPIATLKGLINLEQENLIDQKECIEMMNKCVSEIDEKIIEMSSLLNNNN